MSFKTKVKTNWCGREGIISNFKAASNRLYVLFTKTGKNEVTKNEAVIASRALLVPLVRPIGIEIKTNGHWCAQVFPRFDSGTCIYFEL